MKSEIDEVALQGIEFWSNVCDEEMDLAIEASEVCERVPRVRHQWMAAQKLNGSDAHSLDCLLHCQTFELFWAYAQLVVCRE